MEENPLLLQRQSHFAPQNKEDLIMGIIRAITQAIGGGLADQWLEVYEADDMGDNTVFTSGVLIRKGQNRKGTPDTVSNGSVIHVYDNQFMMLVDGGKVVDTRLSLDIIRWIIHLCHPCLTGNLEKR